ncbi:hypothetical protein OROMI_010451 [Orobanche minor]
MFSNEELEELVAPFEFTLVGKFSHGFPTMKILKSIIGNLNLKGKYSVSLLEHKHVLFRFTCEEDYTRFWSRQVWHMAGFLMRVLKWTPDFDPLVEASFAPVWVKFPYLPIHLFDKQSLFQIASALGKPLRIDSSTAELTRAYTPRVCVEMDYENIPAYCSICKHLGHAFKDCKSSKNLGAVGETAIVRPLHKEVDSAVQHKSSPDRPPSPAVRILKEFEDDSSKRRLTLGREIVQKIRDDISQSYEILPSYYSKKTIRKKPQEGYTREPENEKLVVDKCPNANDRSFGTQNEIVGPSPEVESDIEVVSNSKKKKVKKKKKLY